MTERAQGEDREPPPGGRAPATDRADPAPPADLVKPRSFKGPEVPAAQGRYGIALGWLKRQRLQPAIVNLRQAIEIDPTYIDPCLELGRVLMHLRRWPDLVALAESGLKYHVEIPELHKMMIAGLTEIGGIDHAFATYGLNRLDARDMLFEPGAIICVVTVRNERARLPYFLDYYRRLGVDRFLLVDNMSSDGSADWLLGQDDVRLWQSALPFRAANFGSAWFELLARRYAVGHWLVTVDADEFLVFEGSPERTLNDFCGALDRRGKRAATGLLLDLYSDRPIGETHYGVGEDPLALCHYFDRRIWHSRDEGGGQYQNQTIFFGGVRQRVFRAESDYLLSKTPVVYYQPNTVLTAGQHLTNQPRHRVAQNQIGLLHFKFFSSLPAYARSEAEREMHAMAGTQYKAYARVLEQGGQVTLYDPAHSVRYEGTAQLRALGAMEAEEEDEPVVVPAVARAEPAAGQARPFWSVMISVYDRLARVERAVASVADQASGDMQIEVISDGIGAARNAELGEIIARVGRGRVDFHPHPVNLGHPRIFNLCIERARGEWVHILHDDDWVEPGFYAALRQGIGAAPGVGAAFCQHAIVTGGNLAPTIWRSWVERETTGVIEDWLSRIATECRVQFSAMTVKRAAYEKLGGFCGAARSAFDWEMWARIAVHFPVLYVADTLVGIGRDETAESSKELRSGEQVADGFRAIEAIERTLPADRREHLARTARERMGLYALDVARRYLESDDLRPAVANLKAALGGHPTPRVRRVLEQVIRGVNDEFQS